MIKVFQHDKTREYVLFIIINGPLISLGITAYTHSATWQFGNGSFTDGTATVVPVFQFNFGIDKVLSNELILASILL